MTTRYFRTRIEREAEQFNSAARREQRMLETPATEKQIAFIEKLETELTEKLSKAFHDVNFERIQAQFVSAKEIHKIAKEGYGFNKQVASTYITQLLQMTNFPLVMARTETPTAVATPTREPAPIGVYKKDGDYYRVATLRNSDRRAAYRWNGRRWDYARGYVFQLTADELLSVDEVRAFGLRTGMCAICGRTLTDPESVQKGIGPICEGKYGRFLASVSA